MNHAARRIVPCLLLVATTAALASCELEPDLEFQADAQAHRATNAEIAELRDAACVTSRQIAKAPEEGGSCPAVEGWTGLQLFPDGPGELGDFCLYENKSSLASSPQDLAALDAAVLAHHPDCDAVFEQSSDPLSTALAAPMQLAFYDAVNRIDADDLGLPDNEGLRSPVTVAVVDTIPSQVPEDPRSEHGESMAALVRDLACPALGLECAVDVRNELGMPRVENRQRDLVNGGLYGGFGDLALGIYQAVENAPDSSKLVINLSLGWEPNIFGDDPTTYVPIDAVYRALEYARCHGAVVIAASGNKGHLCEDGPLLPGGWELVDAPTSLRCNALGVANPEPAIPGYRPLVYAVGSLDYGSTPASTTRTASLPRMVATGVHAVPDLGSPRSALTGSSVPTAVVSGTAALIWSFYPQLSGDQLMRTIYRAGAGLGHQAPVVGPSAVATVIRRLDVCAAFDWARSRGDTDFLSVPLDCLLEEPASIDAIAPILGGLTATDYAATFSTAPVPCGSDCVAGPAYLADGVSGAACPSPIDQSLPFTTPQPTHPSCPSCTVDVSSGIVHASLDEAYASYHDIVDVVVTLYQGMTPHYFRFGAVPLSDEEVTRLELDATLMPSVVDSATISITFAGLPQPNDSELILQ